MLQRRTCPHSKQLWRKSCQNSKWLFARLLNRRLVLSRPRFLALAAFIICLPPEKPCDIVFDIARGKHIFDTILGFLFPITVAADCVFTWVDSKGSLEGYQLWIFGLDSFEKYACSCRVCPLELFIVYTFKYKKIPTGNCDSNTRMLQMNPPCCWMFILFATQ